MRLAAAIVAILLRAAEIGVADVRRNDDVVQGQQRISQFDRLRFGHVERGIGQRTGSECAIQCGRINDWSARRIH